MKNTFYSFLIIFSLPVSAFSQEGFFTWSAGSSELNIAFMDIEVMPDHSVVAIVKADGRGYGGVFLQADGEPVSLGLGDGGTGIIRFSPEGEVLWFKTVGDYYGGVYQVEKNAEGEIVVLANVEMNDEYTYQYEEYGDDEEEDYEGEEYEGEDYDEEEGLEEEDEPEEIYLGGLPAFGLEGVDAGCHIIHLGLDGAVRRDVFVPVLEDVIITECHFRAYVNGQYLLAGTGDADLLSKRLNIIQRGDMDEWVMAIDGEGELLWGDLIFYRERGGYIVGGRDITFAPDGTVYYAGTYPYGATFSNGQQILVSVNYEELQKGYEHFEGFVVSYSPKGKINWVKTDGTTSFMGAIAAIEEGVFVSHRTARNKLFGQIVDTTEFKNTGISFLNQKGETQWTLMTGIDKIEAMRIDPQGNAIMLGTFRERSGFFQNTGKIGTFTLPEKHESFLATLSPDGVAQWVKSGDLWIATQNEPFVLAIDGDDSLFIAGMMWVSLPFEINRLDASLPALKAAGGVAIIGRVR